MSFRAATFRVRPYALVSEVEAAQAAAVAHADGLASNYDPAGSAAAAQAAAATYADTAVNNLIPTITSAQQTAEANAASYTDQKVAEVVGAAPDLLNTLSELSAALGDDANFAATLTGQIAAKADQSALDSAITDLSGAIAAKADQSAFTAVSGTVDALDAAMTVLLGASGALEVESTPGAGDSFLYSGAAAPAPSSP
jgi:hypothetical protein